MSHRLVITGDGQDSTLVAYYIASDPRLTKTKIFFIQSIDSTVETVNTGKAILNTASFWSSFFTTMSVEASSYTELSFMHYWLNKPFWFGKKNELSFKPSKELMETWVKGSTPDQITFNDG